MLFIVTVILILIAAVILIVFFTLLGLSFFKYHVIYLNGPFRDKVIVEDIIIDSEWSEYNTEYLINIVYDGHYVGIHLERPYEISVKSGGIKIPNDQIINPEIKLIDENKKEYLMTLSGSRGEKIAHYKYNGKLPSNTIYKKVKIRSSYPIKAKKLLWSTLSIRDMK